MKSKKSLLTTALSIFTISGLMAVSHADGEIPGVAAQSASYFYTGKPFDADLGNYVFAARNYDPAMSRWTSADPSGFPDGANNRIYAPSPFSELDPTGLERRRVRDENFWRGWSLDVFDERGKELLGHWLDGSGAAITTSEGRWGAYMKANSTLSGIIDTQIRNDFANRTTSGTVSLQFHAEIENGYLTGYQMLHGTNSTKGDFTITGSVAITQDANGNKVAKYNFTNTWNDIIDPNHNYAADTFLEGVLSLFYSPQAFDVHLSWNQKLTIE